MMLIVPQKLLVQRLHSAARSRRARGRAAAPRARRAASLSGPVHVVFFFLGREPRTVRNVKGFSWKEKPFFILFRKEVGV